MESIMEKTFICLAKSVREGNLCIAGKEITDQGKISSWFRPVTDQQNAIPKEDCLFEIGDKVSCDVIKYSPISTQNENYVLSKNPNWTVVEKSYKINYSTLLDSPKQLWENNRNSTYGINDKSSASSKEVNGNSLYFIKLENAIIIKHSEPFDNEPNRKRLRLIFIYNKVKYSLIVTNTYLSELYWNKLEIDKEEEIGACYLTISLGKEYEKTGDCYKLVAGYVKI